MAPGADTGHQVHADDCVVVPLSRGILRLVEPTGVRDVTPQTGSTYACEAGVAHMVIDVNLFAFGFVEVELK